VVGGVDGDHARGAQDIALDVVEAGVRVGEMIALFTNSFMMPSLKMVS